MFDRGRFAEALAEYKAAFGGKWWDDERYKWEAVKCFQDNWNIDAADFADVLKRSLAKTGNLLMSAKNFPRGMILEFAEAYAEETRAMFAVLFDDSRDLTERMVKFKADADVLLKKIGKGDLSHYQTENSISVYLWLRFPDKYSIYKFRVMSDVAAKLKSDYIFKYGAYDDNIRRAAALYDEICAELKKDEDLVNMLRSKLTDECWPDAELRTLTGDFGYFVSRRFMEGLQIARKNLQEDEDMWEHSDYSPELSVDDWVELLSDKEVFNESSLEIMKCMKDIGGSASCKQLSLKYGRESNFYNSGSAYLAKRIAGKTNCPVITNEDGSTKWWPILYLGRNASKDEPGVWIWRLRDELSQALDRVDLSGVKLYADDKHRDTYTKDNFLADVYMTEERYDDLRGLLLSRKNIILQGAPGVGKTFAAQRLAYSVMGCRDESRTELVQFHQNYSYEDFVIGYKPTEKGFELRDGVFRRFCLKAEEDPENDYFFIIDEINRGDLSRIFGELLMLIERDYRGTELTLSCGGERFSVPENIFIIGMMNTADRSIAMIDYALRRRFSFFEMRPGFDSDGFKKYLESLNNEILNTLIGKVAELNEEITADRTLGRGFCIGHSYFCGKEKCTDDDLRAIVEYDIIPTLSEYWFDAPDKVRRWEDALRGALPARS